MVIRALLQRTAAALREGGMENAVFEAHLIVRTVLGLSALELVLHGGDAVAERDAARVGAAAERVLAGEPVQYVLGTQEFMSLEFRVTPAVLIPRADTETLVEHVLEQYRNRGLLALDIGTGSGCIALSIAHYNRRAYVRGVDISAAALEIAEQNAKALQLEERAAFEQVDIMRDTFFGQYDLIVSNPPYIETDVIPTLERNVREFEPRAALDGGPDGLDFYRRIVQIAPVHLHKNGMLAFEVGHTQARAVADLMGPGFCGIQIIKDLCGVERVVSGRKRI